MREIVVEPLKQMLFQRLIFAFFSVEKKAKDFRDSLEIDAKETQILAFGFLLK